MRGKASIQVESYKQVQQDLKKAKNKDVPKAVGKAHKEVGQFIIDKIGTMDPYAVGAGKGANIRASAAKREVGLKVGGKHREAIAAAEGVPTRYVQWGKEQKRKSGVPQKQTFAKDARPYIIGTAREHQSDIMDEFEDKVMAALKPAFYNA